MVDRNAELDDVGEQLEEAGLFEQYTDDDDHRAIRIWRSELIEAMPEGRRLELSALVSFINAYSRQGGGLITPVRMPQPPEPDFVCRLDGSRLVGIEIAHVYGSEHDARMVFGRAQPAESTDAARVQHARVPLSDRIPGELDLILRDKCENDYECEGACWLIIRNAYPLWTSDDFVQYALPWVPPDGVPFEQIWLVGDQEGSSGLLQLYPQQGLPT